MSTEICERLARLTFTGGARIHFHVYIVEREQGRIAVNRADPVVTRYAKGHFRFRCERLSIDGRSHFRIELNVPWTSVKNPSDPHTVHPSCDLTVSAFLSDTRFRKSIVSCG